MAKFNPQTGITMKSWITALFLALLFVIITPFVEISFIWLFVDQVVDQDAGAWGVSQMIDSLYPRSTKSDPLGIVSSIESEVWSKWTEKHKDDPIIDPLSVNILDFTDISVRKNARLQVDLNAPILIKGFLNQSGTTSPPWDLDWLKSSPQGDVEVDYVDDARVAFVDGGSVPNVFGPIRQVVDRMEAGEPVKTGTQMLFQQFPDLLYELPLKSLHSIFGHYFFPNRMGKMLTVPMFISKGPKGTKDDETRQTTRTDLHCEPIANVALQFVGSKKWVIISPSQSRGLRPNLSPDGRAYVYANLPPDDTAISKLERYEVILETGDLLYVPTWWWHRVDYIPDVASYTVSLFHVRLGQLLRNNPLYAAALFPNLLKELIGWKTQ